MTRRYTVQELQSYVGRSFLIVKSKRGDLNGCVGKVVEVTDDGLGHLPNGAGMGPHLVLDVPNGPNNKMNMDLCIGTYPDHLGEEVKA